MNVKIINSVNGATITEKRTNCIPRKNENIRIDSKSYEVVEVMHNFDEGCVYIAASPGVSISYVNHFYN